MLPFEGLAEQLTAELAAQDPDPMAAFFGKNPAELDARPLTERAQLHGEFLPPKSPLAQDEWDDIANAYQWMADNADMRLDAIAASLEPLNKLRAFFRLPLYESVSGLIEVKKASDPEPR